MAAAGHRFRYKGRFISERKYNQLSNLSNLKKYLASEAPVFTRYRYKGKFVSEEKARHLAALPRTKKYVKQETVAPYIIRTKTKPDDIAQKLRDALAKDRERAQQRRDEKAAAIRKQIAKDREHDIVIGIAQDAVQHIDMFGGDITEAVNYSIEESAGAVDRMQYFDPQAIYEAAQDMYAEGDDFYEFEMADLEDEDKYGKG